MLFEFSALFRYAVASKHWGASRGFALIMGFRSGSSALTVGRRTACCCGLQVCASSLGMYAPFCFLVSGRLWGWCLESFWGVSVPLPPCSRARRSPSTPLGARGLVVAAHRVVMVTLRARLRCSRPHHLSRHLPQAHLLLMSLNVVKCNLS